MGEYVYHYTSIETLARIFDTRTIRFNRLDYVDDLSECESIDGKHAGRTTFVSCWTGDAKENIPLWKMYAGLDGVRITLPQKWYKEYELNGATGEKKRIHFKNLYIDLGLPYCGPVLPEALVGDNHAVMPDFAPNSFLTKIEYTDDDDKLVPKTVFNEGHSVTVGLDCIGRYKSTYWEFQKEYRYVLRIFPYRNPESSDAEITELFATDLSYDEYPLEDYFVEISNDAFDEMEVVMGPGCNESKRLMLLALLKKYAPNATLKSSELKGKIKPL